MASTATDEPQKASELWFSPEVVVLRAKTRVFRVFVSILKAKSAVFADMFTFPQPASSDLGMLDGIPVVDFYDEPDEMEAFLKAIFDADFFLPPPADYTSRFRDIIGILRLSHKYDVAFLRRRALQHFDVEYPARMFDLTRRAKYPMDIQFLAIQVAIEVGGAWFLPAAFYRLCATGEIRDIITHHAWNDLDENRRLGCISGYAELARYAPHMLESLLVVSDEQDTRCDRRIDEQATCNKTRIRLACGIIASGISRDCINAIPNEVWTFVDPIGTPMCDGCFSDLDSRYQNAKEAFWDGLPGMFGLPDWEELDAMQDSALQG